MITCRLCLSENEDMKHLAKPDMGICAKHYEQLQGEIGQLADALDLQRQVLDHREIKMMEGMAMAHSCRYSDEFGALSGAAHAAWLACNQLGSKKAKVARGE